jgi:ribosomal protein L11 methyltransferase
VTNPLLRVAIRVPGEDRERAIARLLELAPGGFDEVDHGAAIELGVYTDLEGERRLRVAFGDVVSKPVATGWEDGWRAFHRPVRAGGLWIGPPWETPPGEPAVVIDPGRAFGTGAHPTTRLCVELLAQVPPGSLVDVGCGSGVLAIAAGRLGFAPLAAIDEDPVAVEVARENARTNGVELEVRIADALRDPIPVADVGVANVLLAPVEAILARLETRTVVTSGYLEGERPAHRGWTRIATAALDGWAADTFERSA